MRFALFALCFFAGHAAAADDLKAVKTDTEIKFTTGPATVGAYQYAGTVKVEKGEGTKPLAKPFFYPLHTPNGAAVTGFAPADHYHHKSVWFCHGDVIPEGIELKVKSGDKKVVGVDFWSEHTGHGRIVCTSVGEPKTIAAGHITVGTKNDWLAPDGTKILDETRTIHVVGLPAGWLVVFDIDLHATVCPIAFGDTKEGSFGTRIPEEIGNPKGGNGKLTADGGRVGEKPIWGQPIDWMDYSGTIAGKPAGLSVFDDPRNAARAISHGRAYGLVSANPFGRGQSFPSQKGKTDLVKIPKGEHLKLRYAAYAHDGDVVEGKVAEAYQLFSTMKQ